MAGSSCRARSSSRETAIRRVEAAQEVARRDRRSHRRRGTATRPSSTKGSKIGEGLPAPPRARARRRRRGRDGAALDVPASGRLKQVRANLERWRWITQDLGERYIIVNVADFRVGVVEAGREDPVHAGRRRVRLPATPDFSGKMSYLEINPTWTVPPKLVREDILPKVRKDPGLSARIRVSGSSRIGRGAREIDPGAVDWSAVDGGDACPTSSARTPGRRTRSAGSSSCSPINSTSTCTTRPSAGSSPGGAGLQLGLHPGRTTPRSGRIPPAGRSGLGEGEDPRDAIDSEETPVVVLRKPLNVHLLYWTAWLDGDGRAQFRKDIYLRDAALDRALEEAGAGARCK